MIRITLLMAFVLCLQLPLLCQDDKLLDYNKTIRSMYSHLNTFSNNASKKSYLKEISKIEEERDKYYSTLNNSIASKEYYWVYDYTQYEVKKYNYLCDQVEYHTKAIKAKPTPEGYYERAQCKKYCSDFQGAIADYTEAINWFKRMSNVKRHMYLDFSYDARGRLYFIIGEYQSAINDLEKIGCGEFGTIGIAYYRLGKYTKAIKSFKRHEQTTSPSDESLTIADCYIQLKKYNAAIERCNASIKNKRNSWYYRNGVNKNSKVVNEKAVYKRAVIRLLYQKNYRKAIEDFTVLLTENKSNKDYYYYLVRLRKPHFPPKIFFIKHFRRCDFLKGFIFEVNFQRIHAKKAGVG